MTTRCSIQFEMLVDFHEGRTSPSVTRQMHWHLQQGCADCKRRLEWLNQMIPALHRAVTEEPPIVPAAVLAEARNIARERRPAAQPPLLTRLARLVFDSRQPEFAFGTRDAESNDLQALYSTEENDVDLWQERQGADHWYLMGQVLPRDGGTPIMPTEVVLAAADGRKLTTRPATEEFTVTDVPRGTYEIRLRLPDHEIVLPDVVVGA